MKARLIALRVKPNETGRVGKLIEIAVFRCPILLHKKLVQPGIKVVAPPHQLNQTGNVVLYMERIQPRVYLREIVPPTLSSTELWIEVRDPLPILAFRSHKADFRIEYVSIVARQLHEIDIVILLTESFCQLGHTPVVIARLERYRNRLAPLSRDLRNCLNLPCGQSWEEALIKVHMVQA